MVDLGEVSTSADSGADSTLDEDANRFVDNTYDEDNYDTWATNSELAAQGEDGFTAPAEALSNRYGMDESELSGYTDKHQTRTQEAIDEGAYEDGLQTFATEDEADNAWAQRFISGLQNTQG